MKNPLHVNDCGDGLAIGSSEVDITPPPGEPVFLCGSLEPWGRPASGTYDPLFVRTLVIRGSGGVLALTQFDVSQLQRDTLRPALFAIQVETGIPEDRPVWWCSHTHSAPMPEGAFPEEYGEVHSPAVMRQIIAAYQESVRSAAAALRPAAVRRLRAFDVCLRHNRRLRFKNGREINTWLLDGCDDVQCLGSAGPIDPEIGLLAFDDPDGSLLVVLYHVTLATWSLFGKSLKDRHCGRGQARGYTAIVPSLQQGRTAGLAVPH